MARDLRKYASQTTFRLILGALILLFVVGLGLIWWLYGFRGAVLGFFCLLGALVPLGLILFFIFGLDAVVKRFNRDR
jgi:hypothetical protein